MLLHCLLSKQISVPANLAVVLILVTFSNVIYLDVLEMAAKLTRVWKRRWIMSVKIKFFFIFSGNFLPCFPLEITKVNLKCGRNSLWKIERSIWKSFIKMTNWIFEWRKPPDVNHNYSNSSNCLRISLVVERGEIYNHI